MRQTQSSSFHNVCVGPSYRPYVLCITIRGSTISAWSYHKEFHRWLPLLSALSKNGGLQRICGVRLLKESYDAAPRLANRGNNSCLSWLQNCGDRLFTLFFLNYLVDSYSHLLGTSISVHPCIGAKTFWRVELHCNLSDSSPLVPRAAVQLDVWPQQMVEPATLPFFTHVCSSPTPSTLVPQHVCFCSSVSVHIRPLMGCSDSILSFQ